MEWLLVFGLGLFFGWLFTWFWFSTTTRWKKSKDLRAGSAKTLKEQSEKADKARQDANWPGVSPCGPSSELCFSSSRSFRTVLVVGVI